MSYAELIKELHRRSGMQINEYAEAIDISVAHLSNILNNKQAGSRKILEDALAYAGMSLESLCLPEADPATQQEKDVLRLFRALSDERRELACALLRQLFVAQKTEKRRPHK